MKFGTQKTRWVLKSEAMQLRISAVRNTAKTTEIFPVVDNYNCSDICGLELSGFVDDSSKL